MSKLTLLARDVGRTADGRVLSKWLCACGKTATISHSRVMAGTTKSCGCLNAEVVLKKVTKHGGRHTPEYSCWVAMKRRCEQPNDKDYHRYGARGISVCPQWANDFAKFRDDVGPRPDGTTLDRIDTTGNYEPGNVRWATPEVQSRNRRGSYVWHIKGRSFECIGDAAKAFNVSAQSIHRWVNGQFDRRRGTFTAPRDDCTAKARYS